MVHIPHGWVKAINPIGVNKLNDEGADDDDDRPKSIPKDMKEHTEHVHLASRL